MTSFAFTFETKSFKHTRIGEMDRSPAELFFALFNDGNYIQQTDPPRYVNYSFDSPWCYFFR